MNDIDMWNHICQSHPPFAKREGKVQVDVKGFKNLIMFSWRQGIDHACTTLSGLENITPERILPGLIDRISSMGDPREILRIHEDVVELIEIGEGQMSAEQKKKMMELICLHMK